MADEDLWTNLLFKSITPSVPRLRVDRASLFETGDLHAGLGQRSARGGASVLLTTGVGLVATTVSTILITRNLTDVDFGLYGMVAVTAGFAAMFVDLGLSRAVIQAERVTHEQASVLFWLNLLVSGVVGVLLALATPLLVWVYDEPALAPINLVIAGLFFASALGLQHRALLVRRLEHQRLSLVNLVVSPIAAAVAVGIALAGGRYWALVALPATAQVASTACMWILCPWLPGRPRRGTGARALLGFGANVTGFEFLNYFARNADNGMIGFAWGAGPLGLYTRAYSLMMLPASKLNGPIGNVIVPTLSRLQGSPERYRKTYRDAMTLTSGVTTPVALLLIAVCFELVPLLLGPQWDAVPWYFLALTGAVLHASTNAAAGWIFLSFGHTDRMLRWTFMTAPLSLIAMVIGLQWGGLGVATALSIQQLSMKLPGLSYAMRGTPLSIRDFLEPVWLPTLASLAAMGAAFSTEFFKMRLDDPIAQLLAKTFAFLLAYAGFLLLLPQGRLHVNVFRRAISSVKAHR